MKKTLLFALCASMLVVAGCTKPAPTNNPTSSGATAEKTAPTDGTDYTAFATCLANAKLHMYGTEWCGHCKDQKAMFGDAFAKVTYTDCDKQRQACIDAGVQGFPTWIDAAGNKYPGTQTMAKLGEVAGCSMDGTATKPVPTAQTGVADTGAKAPMTGNADTGAKAPMAETGATTTGA